MTDLDVTPTSVVEFSSAGRLLIIGEREAALEVGRPDARRICLHGFHARPAGARRSSEIGGNTIITGGQPDISGWLGEFEVGIRSNGLTAPTSRAAAGKRKTGTDLVLDLADTPCMKQQMPPLGYFHAGQ